jgi:thiamine biosynthesis lipoprotein
MKDHIETFEAIGTLWHLQFSSASAILSHKEIMERVRERIRQFDMDYSRFRNDSLVAQIARAAGTYRMPEDAALMMELYADLYRQSGGAFTPLIGSTLVDAGYDAEYSLLPKTLHAPIALEDAYSFNAPYLTAYAPILFDFGAAGKGYLIDIVSHVLKDAGVRSYVIDAGGDILVHMDEPVEIGLENPDDAAEAIGIAALRSGSICGSSGKRRAWNGYHHIIDPRTLASPEEIRAAWVVADTAMVADALVTSLFLVPPSQLSGYDFEYLIMLEDGAVEASPAFPARIFTRS